MRVEPGLALFGLLLGFARRRHRDGDVIIAYAAIYAIGRFALEFFRGDADRGFIFGGLLSTSQFIGIILVILAVLVLVVLRAARD